METLTSRKNPLAARFRRLAEDRAARREEGFFLGQGRKLLEEALASGCLPETVMYAGEEPKLPEQVRRVAAAKELLAWISPMKSAPEVIFTVRIPRESGIPRGRLLLAEDMQDPGNVGTMIRTAAAFGFDGLLLAGACADPWGPKAVRASMGAVFRLRILERESVASALDALAAEHLPLYAAALSEQAETVGRVRFPEKMALAVGNEGHGLSGEVLRAAYRIVRIPMAPGAESLNAAAAAAVLMWETYRERDKNV